MRKASELHKAGSGRSIIGEGDAMTDLAKRLSEARLKGGTVSLAAGELADDIEAAQQVQDAVWALLGDACGGWKIGSTSTESQQRLGTTQPSAARIPLRSLYPNAAKLALHPEHTPAIEAEFALRLGRDLPPRASDYGEAEVAAAVVGVAPAVEIAGTRFEGTLSQVLNRTTMIADGGFGLAVVTGSFLTNWRELDLANHRMIVSINGVPVGEGSGARVMGDPFKALVWLANNQRTKSGLKTGEIVSTGSCTKMFAVQVGDTIEADFGTLGTVTATLLEAE